MVDSEAKKKSICSMALELASLAKKRYSLQSALVKLGVSSTMCMFARDYVDDPVVLVNILAAIDALATGDDHSKVDCAQEGLCAIIITALRKNREDFKTISSCCTTATILCNSKIRAAMKGVKFSGDIKKIFGDEGM